MTMKEHRFIELLNLYIDRQITAEETVELEAELQHNPKRQAIYRQYCQIHSATKSVYESFRTVAADQPAPVRPGVIETFETRRRRTSWAYYGGGLAVAACLALVFVRHSAEAPSAAPQLAAVSAPVVERAAIPVAPVVEPLAAAPQPGLVSLRNTTAVTPDYTAMLAALREQDEERAFYHERLQAGRVQPLFNDNMFETRQVLSAQEQRVFRSQPATPAQQAEFSAFQFQR